MTRIIVIGGASLDVLHFAGRTERAAGGAGLYTALAAERAGARVTMVGPRPEPVPPELTEAMARLDWRGPVVPPAELPTFEIEHCSDGATELRRLRSRAEAELTVGRLPADLPAGFVYCIALADPDRQVEFLRHFKGQGRRVGAGTFGPVVRERPDAVAECLRLADVFFCNEREAAAIFGDLESARAAPGKLLCVTRGARGARVIQGDHATDVPAPAVDELDPTGAGDTFCGATLTWLERGLHPVLAAERGVAAAADMVTGVGPERLLAGPAHAEPPPGRVAIDPARIERIGAALASLPEVEPFAFTGPLFPAAGSPGSLALFFASTLQQFGFWTDAESRYERPIVATLDGRTLKGSDFLAACYRRWLAEDPAGLTPAGQARLTAGELAARLSADDGGCPLPDLDRRLQLARRYGSDLLALGRGPADLVREANGADRPLTTFLRLLDRVGGYKEDPLRKKSALLALILRQRPEAFLRAAPGDDAPPIVDYHVQRSCLRMGLVRVVDPSLAGRLTRRELIDPADEAEVRRAAAAAVEQLRRASGRPMGAIDRFLFQNRTRCPEMTEPDCPRCPVDAVCAHARELFQPVLRTTFY